MRLSLFIVLASFAWGTHSAAQSGRGDSIEPELPRVYLDTRAPAEEGAVRTVPDDNCNDAVNGLQAQINAAELGDTIVIPSGTLCAGNYMLARKDSGPGWITIRGSDVAGLPPEGMRVTPAYAPAMPKIRTPNSAAAIGTAAAAHHYRLIGLDIGIADQYQGMTYNMVYLDGVTRVLADVPSDIVLDRVYVHGDAAKTVRRGVTINCARCAVVDSYIAEIHEVGADSQAIAGWTGPGPFKIVNNYLEASGENILIGGSPMLFDGISPADIEIRRNHLYKPYAWRISSGAALPAVCLYDPLYGDRGEYFGVKDAGSNTVAWHQCNAGSWVEVADAPRRWSVKNLFELKHAQRVLFDGNLVDQNWPDAQTGFAILFQGLPSDSGLWARVLDVTVSHNIIRRSTNGMNLCGGCVYTPAQTTRPEAPNYVDPSVPLVDTVKFVDNILEDIPGTALQVLNNTRNIAFEHNTSFAGRLLVSEGPRNAYLRYLDNIVNHGPNALGDGKGNGGVDAMNNVYVKWAMTGNMMFNAPSFINKAWTYPAGNFYLKTVSEVGFVDYPGRDYHVADTVNGQPDRFKFNTSNSVITADRDPGADIDAVGAEIAQALSGGAVPSEAQASPGVRRQPRPVRGAPRKP